MAPRWVKPSSKVTRPNGSWKKTADMPIVATARAMIEAIGLPWTPHLVESDTSAIAATVAVLGCSNSRTIIGEK